MGCYGYKRLLWISRALIVIFPMSVVNELHSTSSGSQLDSSIVIRTRIGCGPFNVSTCECRFYRFMTCA